MFKQDNKEKNSNDLLTDFVERTGLTIDEPPVQDIQPSTESEALPMSATDAPLDDPTYNMDAEDEIDPLSVRVFGLPRIQFWGVTLGIGCGYILHGILSMFIKHSFSVWWPAIACAGIGYLITGRMYKKHIAAQQEQPEQND